MKPTLTAGDTIFVWKWPFQTKKSSKLLQRGELIVFSEDQPLGSGNQANYIRRIIGLPGDRIEMKAGHIFLNSQPLALPQGESPGSASESCYAEKLPSSHRAFQICIDPKSPAEFNEQKVPENHYLAVGDWRTQTDSKKGSFWSIVPISSIEGQPWVVWLSIDYSKNTGLIPRIRWERMFQKIE